MQSPHKDCTHDPKFRHFSLDLSIRGDLMLKTRDLICLSNKIVDIRMFVVMVIESSHAILWLVWQRLKIICILLANEVLHCWQIHKVSSFQNFQIQRVLLIPNCTSNIACCLFIISMTKLEFVFKYLSAFLFVFIEKINCTAVQLMK